jgi:hypothetical protein
MVFWQWWQDSRRNPFLFWAIIAGFVTIFPTLYIPVINHKVFKHQGISWEWSIVVVESILFFAGCELWKWLKRAYFRRVEKTPSAKANEEVQSGDLEKNDSQSSDRVDSDESKGEKRARQDTNHNIQSSQ